VNRHQLLRRKVAIGRKQRSAWDTYQAALLAHNRQIVLQRAEGRCEMPGCDEPIEDVHHRKRQQHNGTHHIDNLMGLCRPHHGWVHQHPRLATQAGYLVASWDDVRPLSPTTRPVGP